MAFRLLDAIRLLDYAATQSDNATMLIRLLFHFGFSKKKRAPMSLIDESVRAAAITRRHKQSRDAYFRPALLSRVCVI